MKKLILFLLLFTSAYGQTKISELPSLSTVTDSAIFVVVTDSTRRIYWTDLMADIVDTVYVIVGDSTPNTSYDDFFAPIDSANGLRSDSIFVYRNGNRAAVTFDSMGIIANDSGMYAILTECNKNGGFVAIAETLVADTKGEGEFYVGSKSTLDDNSIAAGNYYFLKRPDSTGTIVGVWGMGHYTTP